jgi:hypothetical protein
MHALQHADGRAAGTLAATDASYVPSPRAAAIPGTGGRLSVCLSVHPSISPSVNLSIRLSVCPSVNRSGCHPRNRRPSVCLSVCLSVHPSPHLSTCQSICPSAHLSIRAAAIPGTGGPREHTTRALGTSRPPACHSHRGTRAYAGRGGLGFQLFPLSLALFLALPPPLLRPLQPFLLALPSPEILRPVAQHPPAGSPPAQAAALEALEAFYLRHSAARNPRNSAGLAIDQRGSLVHWVASSGVFGPPVKPRRALCTTSRQANAALLCRNDAAACTPRRT